MKRTQASQAASATSGAAVFQAVSTRFSGAPRIALAAAVLLLIGGIVAFTLKNVPERSGQQPPGSEQTESRLPTPQTPGPQGEGKGEVKHPEQQQNKTTQVAPTESMPSDSEPTASGTDQDQTAGSASNETADAVPASSKMAPKVPPIPGAPTPALRVPTTKKTPAPKASRQDHRQVPSHQWIQTR